MKYVFVPVLLVVVIAFGQTWVVEQIDSTAASGSPVELVKAADGRLWTGYETKSGVVRVACLGDSGWSKTDLLPASTPGSVWRPFLAAGPHGELCLSCCTQDSDWIYRLVGDSWQGEHYPFTEEYPGGATVAYDTSGHLYTSFLPGAGDFWVGHETDSGWTSERVVSLFIYGWFWVDVGCLSVAGDDSPWYSAYVDWEDPPYHWGEENALMHCVGDSWVEVSGGSAVPLALTPHGDSIGWVSVVLRESVLLCDGDTVASGIANSVAGLAYSTDDAPLVTWVPRNASADPVFAFKTDRWRTEGIPGPAGSGGIDIEVDTSGQVLIVYSTQDSGLWCARGKDVVGVADSPKPQVSSYKPAATVLSGASGVERLASSVVFDAMGRRVVNPRSGVYFLRSASSLGRDASRVTKVVIQR